MRSEAIQEEINALLTSRVWADQAACMHAEVAECLRENSYQVFMEYGTKHLGDRRKGRIDIVAVKNEVFVGIELDCRKPRRRSIEKLRLFSGIRIIGVRGIEGQPVPEGIDDVVTMRVRVPSAVEAKDKRTTRRNAS